MRRNKSCFGGASSNGRQILEQLPDMGPGAASFAIPSTTLDISSSRDTRSQAQNARGLARKQAELEAHRNALDQSDFNSSLSDVPTNPVSPEDCANTNLTKRY